MSNESYRQHIYSSFQNYSKKYPSNAFIRVFWFNEKNAQKFRQKYWLNTYSNIHQNYSGNTFLIIKYENSDENLMVLKTIRKYSHKFGDSY